MRLNGLVLPALRGYEACSVVSHRRASDAVMSRANAWISSFAVESVEDMERRFQMELEQNRSQ